MAFVIYSATEDDLNDISALVNSAYRGDSSRAGWTTEADYLDGQRTDPDSLRAELSKGKILCLREEDELRGCVYLEKFTDAKGTACYLGMLTVDPRQQAAGLGRLLLERAEAFARRWGATRMRMGVVNLRDSLMAWYERRGYQRTGETQPFPYGNERFGIPLRDDLHFVMFEKPLE